MLASLTCCCWWWQRRQLPQHHNLAPLLLLFLLTVAWPLRQWLRGRRLRLPPFLFHVWVVLLALAWLIKLCGSRAWW